MKWRWRRASGHVIDVPGRQSAGGIPGGRVALPGGLGVVGVLVFLAIQVLGGGTAFSVPSAFEDGTQASDAGANPRDQDLERDLRDVSAYVFDDARAMWAGTIDGYREAKLVLYRVGVDTGCGAANSAVGPFYCPADERVYLDLSFYGDMEQQLQRRATSRGPT